uniref:Uncharacterized protein n=1 Tax=Oryza meridionalis TaxID=40149 RepID=A0A0E0C2E3_9ORYZ
MGLRPSTTCLWAKGGARIWAEGFPCGENKGLTTRLADAIGKGTRDQNSDALVEDLTSRFARCQQLLNSISGELSSKSIVE